MWFQGDQRENLSVPQPLILDFSPAAAPRGGPVGRVLFLSVSSLQLVERGGASKHGSREGLTTPLEALPLRKE